MSESSVEWVPVGGVSSNHGEILIIANHGVRVSPDSGIPWERFIGYTTVTSERSPDGATEQLVADICSPGWETPGAAAPLHVREDAFIVRAARPSAYDIEARACEHPGHTGWCEVRIKLHNHIADDDDPDDEAVSGP